MHAGGAVFAAAALLRQAAPAAVDAVGVVFVPVVERAVIAARAVLAYAAKYAFSIIADIGMLVYFIGVGAILAAAAKKARAAEFACCVCVWHGSYSLKYSGLFFFKK